MSDPTYLPIPLPEETNDKRPLPEIIADHYGFALAYHDADDGRFYAVQDWIRGLSETPDVSKFWDNMKRRLKKAGIVTSSSWRGMPYQTSNGAIHQRDHAIAEVLYMITQRMDANSVLRNNVLEFLAKAGVVVDEIRIDPDKALDAAIEAYRRMGKTDKWITARIQGKVMRMRFTTAFRNALQRDPSALQYALITDELRVGLWKRNSKALRKQMGLPDKANVREHMSTLALTYEMLAENISAEEMEQHKNLKFDESKAIVRRNAQDVGEHAERTSRRLGKDIVTDKPLLEE
jgi:DNA-damage-inducible protein D